MCSFQTEDEEDEVTDIEPGSKADASSSQWTFGSRERDYRKEAEPDIADALPRLKVKKIDPKPESKVQVALLHVWYSLTHRTCILKSVNACAAAL